MKILTLLLSLLGLSLLAPVAAAQTPVDVLQGYTKEIRAERADTLADLDTIFEYGTTAMVTLAKSGASRLEIQRVADSTMRALDRRAKQGVQRIHVFEDEGLAALAKVKASPYLLKRLERVASRSVAAVMFRHDDLYRQTAALLEKLT